MRVGEQAFLKDDLLQKLGLDPSIVVDIVLCLDHIHELAGQMYLELEGDIAAEFFDQKLYQFCKLVYVSLPGCVA